LRFGEVVIINKSMKKIKLFVIAVVIIAGSLFMWQYVNNFLSKSRAAVDRVDLTLSPKSETLKVGEEKTIVLLIKPQLVDGDKKISGIDLTIAAEGNISILGLTPPAPFPLGSNTNLKGAQLINDVKEKQARIAYVYSNPSSELASILQIQLRIKGTAPGSGKLVINKEKTEIAGIATGNVFELGLVDETNFSVDGQAGPSVTLQISPKTTQKKVGEAFPLTFQITDTPEGKGISAFTINLSYDKDLLEIISVGDPIDAVTNGDKDKFTQGKKEINQNKGEIILSYLSTVPQDQLPKKPKIEIQVKGKKTGTGEFKIVSAQVTGNIAENEYQTSIENASYDITSAVVPICQSFTDDFSGESLNESNWRFVSWTNGYGTVGTAGTLNIHLPSSTEVGAKSTFVESKKILIGNFSSEITLISRNDLSTYEFFQFNNKAYGEAVTGGFGFRILNGSLYTEVYGTDNPNNPGPSNHNIPISNTTPIKLKLEKVGNTAKMSIDKMGGQGYQIIRVFENFSTNSGYVIAGVQHTGSANLAISASFDNYSQTCLNPSVTPTPSEGNIKLNLKLKFQGILGKPSDALNKMAIKIKLLNESTGVATDYRSADFTADDKGIWSGNISFNADVNAKYTLYVKGAYHLQKKICDEKPTETATGTYRCDRGKITLNAGDNNFDLSGIVLLAGDLPVQDGSVTAYDTSLVRNNLGKTDTDEVSNADVNRDGKVDTQDYSLIIASLSVKNDEE